MTTRETWYVLEDGSKVDPRDVAPDGDGVLRHKGGVAVAMGPHGPRSSGVDAEQERAKGEKAKDMKPGESKRPYRTRESRSE